MSHCFQRLSKTYYLLLDYIQAFQSVLIKNIRFLTFSFITTTLQDVLDKTNIKVTQLIMWNSAMEKDVNMW